MIMVLLPIIESGIAWRWGKVQASSIVIYVIIAPL